MSQPAGDIEAMSGDDDLPPREALMHSGPGPARAAHGQASGRVRSRNTARAAARLPQAVLEGLVRHEPEALGAFYDAYFGRIYGYVKRLVHDEHLTEDLTQEILMHIHRAFGSYDASRALSPWVFTIATNKLRDFWQSRRFQESRRQVSLDDEGAAPLTPPARSPGPRVELECRELGERIEAAVARLPEGLRVPFWLRWHEELSFADIAAQLDLSEVAARKRFSRALGELRRLLLDPREGDVPGGAR